MNIQNIISSQITKNKFAREEAKINKYVKIHDINTYGDSFNQMYNARKTMANYASKKGITIDIYDARKLLEEDDSVSPAIKDKFAEKINVVVTDLLSGRSKAKLVSSNTDKTYPKEAKSPILFATNDNCTDVVRQSVRTTEDSFIRNLYRNIEELVHDVTGQKSK